MRSYRLYLLPLALAGIVIATAVPVELGAFSGWNWRVQPIDILQNLALYLPLGIALSRLKLARVALAAALLSFAIEVGQLWQAGRFASLVDVACNTAGAVLAAWFCRRLSERAQERCRSPRVTLGRLLLPCAMVFVALSNWNRPVKPVNLSEWDPGYPMQLGNERGGGRPWRGTVADLRVQAGNTVVAVAGPVSLTGGDAIVVDSAETRRFVEQAAASGQFLATATITTGDTGQSGPARIISLSADTLHRNFDLGQDGRSLVLRVRTQPSGLNGQAGRVISLRILEAGVPYRVEASFDGRVSRLKVDGRLVGRSDLGARGCWAAAFCGWAIPIWAVMGGTAALVLLALFPVVSALAILLLCAGGSVTMIAVISRLPAWLMVVGTAEWMPVVTLLGGVTVGIARILAIRRELRPVS
jgi:hypothetical protein